jgi:hypothetical protein
MSAQRVFQNVLHAADAPAAKPCDQFLVKLDAFIEARDPYRTASASQIVGNGAARERSPRRLPRHGG